MAPAAVYTLDDVENAAGNVVEDSNSRIGQRTVIYVKEKNIFARALVQHFFSNHSPIICIIRSDRIGGSRS